MRGSIPPRYAGLSEGDAHVIRNAGGRATDDAIRSLVISYKLLGTREFFVIHHTNCGMEFFTNDVMRDLLNSSLETAELSSTGFRDVGKGPGSRAGEYIEWLTIKNQKQSVLDDVARIRNHPLVPKVHSCLRLHLRRPIRQTPGSRRRQGPWRKRLIVATKKPHRQLQTVGLLQNSPRSPLLLSPRPLR